MFPPHEWHLTQARLASLLIAIVCQSDESLAELYNREIITFQTVKDFCGDHEGVSKLISSAK